MNKFVVLRRSWARSLAFICASILLPAQPALSQTNVTTQHNDPARSGANLTETVLTTANVNVTQFGKLFERTVDDEVYGQPLYVSNVNVPTVGVRNVLYVATVSNSVYAFDADNPAATAPLWRVTYIHPPQVVPVNRTDVGQACGTYLDFAGNIGIVGTPVIDVARQTMYFVARTKESGAFVQRLHAIDIRDGSERPNSPVNIQATVPGTGDGSDAQHNVAFNSRTQNQRAALLLQNGAVYIAWGSHCDQGPYHGWVLGYDATTLQQTTVFNTTPNGGLGGIWHSGRGLSADASGNIYALVGNGTFDADVGGTSYSNTFLKINPAGTVLDWFTPHNWEFLNTTDADLFHGALLVPDTNLAVGGGKQGVLYVLNRDNMGHFRAGSDNQIVQSFQASTSGRMNGSPIYWNSPNNGPVIYLWPGGDPLKAFRLVNGLFQTTPVAQSSQLAPSSMPGGILSLSADGSVPGTGIVWAALSAGGDANNQTQPGMLRAYDASDVTRQLWNSQQNATRDSLGNFSKFTPPTIVNGKVYLATFSNKVVAYGLLAVTGNMPPVVNAGVDQSIVLPATATLTGTVTDDGNPNPPNVVTKSWSKVGGPGTVTFSAPTALTTTATFSTAGTYTMRLTANDSAATSFDDVIVTVNSSGTGTGLQAQYFNDLGTGTYFTALALERNDAVVDFAWPTAAPAAGVQADNFSVRWTGLVQAPVAGDYRFSTLSNDGVRLWINGQLVIDNWTDHGELTDTSAALPLTAGTTYVIRLEFYDHLGPATVRLMWDYPGQTQQTIPQLQLYPPLPTNQPPTADAGSDQLITLPAVAALRGSASDDGLPNPPGVVTVAWSMVSGREGSVVTFSNPNSLSTDASFPLPGVYVLRLTVGDSGLTVSDDITVTVNPAPSGAGQGLTGQYFNDPGPSTRFAQLVVTRTDQTVDFDWGLLAPAPGVQIDNFSVRWTGRVQAVVTGPHVFTTTADDGVRLWLNNQLIIDNWVDQGATTRSSAPVSLTANVLYDVRLEFYDHDEDAVVRLEWSYPGQAQGVIPRSQLYPATGLPNQPPTVSAGADRAVTLPSTLAITGTTADDGLPIPPGIVAVTWSQVSGPGVVTFSAANSVTTTVTFPVAGAYTLRLTGTDGAFTATDDVVVTVNPGPGTGLTGQYYNDPGTGSRFTTLVLTRTDATVNFTWGTASPAAGVQADNFSVIWTGQLFAPVTGNYTFSTISTDGVRLWVNGQLVISNWTDHNSTTNTGAAIGLTSGTMYDIRLEYYEATGDATARLRWAYTGQNTQAIPQSRLYPATIPVNQAPIVNAGVDRTITLPATASLAGTATDDGFPNPPALVTTAWTMVSGPGTVTFGTPAALTTTATFSVAGSYVLRLTASDSTLSASDDVAVTVNPVTNQAPTVNAGVDQTITLPSTASLVGTATDDGLPNPPASLTTAWTMVSGPGTVTFGTPAALTTTATFNVAGVYVLRLTALDSALSRTDDVTVTVNSPTNQVPTVNAGVDQTITLPATASLAGTATDDGLPNPPATLTTAWTMVSGPGTVTFGTPAALTTTATFSVAGSYVLRLTASDSALSRTDDVAVTVNPPANQAPSVNAGVDQTITLPSAASLVGTATDDGLPNPPASVTTAWTMVSGPGTVTFGTPAALTTTATFSVAGAYVLRLTASDSALSRTDDVAVTVNPPVNQAPTVNAGVDRTITLPATASLAGTATDDGLPNPPAVLTTTWSRVSGPGTVTFGTPAALTTTATFSVAGVYILRLTASDSALSRTDDVTVTVNSPTNQVPTVNAGVDQTITLPATASLVGTATDDGLPNPPASLTTAWTMVSGPGTVTFGTPAALTTTATFSVAGSYVLRLTAFDGALSGTDDVVVTVNAASTGSGTGLTGQYYNDNNSGTRFRTLVLTRLDPTINFDWGSGSPASVVHNQNFSARWTGEIEAVATGAYTFSAASDDGVRLWVNGQLILDYWVDQGLATRTSAPVSLVAGTKYAIVLEYYERTGGAVIRLQWAYPGQATQVVPQSRLYP